MLLVFGLIVFSIGVFIVCLRNDHLVSVFLGMEFMALGSFILMGFLPSFNSFFVLLVLLCMAVSEAAVILSFMVQVTRLFGSDEVKIISVGQV